VSYPALGGCIFSLGNVTLSGSRLSYCSASGLSGKATGGAIYAAGDVGLYADSSITASLVFSPSVAGAGGAIYAKGNATIKYSVVSGNSLSSGKAARGGGVRALGNISTKYATINANSVSSSLVADGTENTYKYAAGGGLSAGQDITVTRSTVSNNTSNGSFAGIDGLSNFVDAPGNTMRIFNSTISGNHADKLVGGVYSNNGNVKIYNSTIAFNTAVKGRIGDSPFEFLGPGLALVSATNDVHVTLQSSLLSNNTYGGAEVDLTTAYDSTDLLLNNVTFNVGPANNLIRTRFTKNPVPNDTIEFDCPLLGTLRDNGGLTKTHALMSTSPAIDHGNNSLYDPMNASFYNQDQRGLYVDEPPYLYPRESNGTADIGAFEVNQDDTLFNSNFEGCPEIF
jgi:predicted outer membrane repeat protein